MYFNEDRVQERIKSIFLKKDFFKCKSLKKYKHSEYKEVINEILDILNLPNFLDKYPEFIYNEFTLNEISKLIWHKTSSSLCQLLTEHKCTPTFLNYPIKNKILKARVLGIEGLYPNIQIEKGLNIYTFRNNIPLLITENFTHQRTHSEVSFLNDSELKIASSIILASSFLTGFLYFNNLNTFEIDARAFGSLERNRTIDLVFELLMLKFQNHYRISPMLDNAPLVSNYSFYNYNENSEYFDEIYNQIDETDQLLMRVLFYLVKSKMLWENRCFGEDAISNIFFSIEGSLLLLQRKFGYSDKKIDLSNLEIIFNNNFDSGNELFGIIKEGYNLRISIVHANPKNGVNWLPNLLADDFIEYYDICRLLIIFILIDKISEINY